MIDTPITIAVQTFNKADTVIATLQSIRHCDGAGECRLLIVQDGLEGNRLMRRYVSEHRETQIAIEQWLAADDLPFIGIEFRKEHLGRGTAGTARFMIDLAFEKSEEVIFTEDDVIFEKDALHWFCEMLAHEGAASTTIWAIAGESKYFDLKDKVASEEHTASARAIAEDNDFARLYTPVQLMPSSCFATTRAKWAEFAETRGMPRGPMFVVERCRQEEKEVLWPLVARCSDIGMHHERGYSMTLKKSADAVPGKAIYLASGALSPVRAGFRQATRDELIKARPFFGA